MCIFTTALHTLRVTLCRVTIAPASRRQRATSSSISWSPTPPPPTSRQIQPSLPAPPLRQTLPDETCRDLPWSCCVRCSSVTGSKPVREVLIGQGGANHVAGWSEWWVVLVYIKLSKVYQTSLRRFTQQVTTFVPENQTTSCQNEESQKIVSILFRLITLNMGNCWRTLSKQFSNFYLFLFGMLDKHQTSDCEVRKNQKYKACTSPIFLLSQIGKLVCLENFPTEYGKAVEECLVWRNPVVL